MSSLWELAAQYRVSGQVCKNRLRELQERIQKDGLGASEEYELRRNITMLTAMSRDCIATSNYLKSYAERRQQLAKRRETTGI